MTKAKPKYAQNFLAGPSGAHEVRAVGGVVQCLGAASIGQLGSQAAMQPSSKAACQQASQAARTARQLDSKTASQLDCKLLAMRLSLCLRFWRTVLARSPHTRSRKQKLHGITQIPALNAEEASEAPPSGTMGSPNKEGSGLASSSGSGSDSEPWTRGGAVISVRHRG
jgi:hypothetical protein